MSDKCKWGECLEGVVSTAPTHHRIIDSAKLVGLSGLSFSEVEGNDPLAPGSGGQGNGKPITR